MSLSFEWGVSSAISSLAVKAQFAKLVMDWDFSVGKAGDV
jgi:hypothetical protein